MILSEFQTWALAQGQVGKYNDGGFVGQCVSLVNQYCWRVLDVPADSWGNAAWWGSTSNTAVMTYFDHVGSPQAGDIGVMGTNYGNGAGHIFVYLSPSQILEQNGNLPLHIGTRSPYANPIAILRKKGGLVNPTDILRIIAGEVEGYGNPEVYNGDHDQELKDAWGEQPIENFIRHGFQQASKAGSLKYQLLDKIASLEKQLADAQNGQYVKVDETLYRKK